VESYVYTLTGNKLKEINGTVTTTNTYDGAGRLISAADTNNATGAVTTKYYAYDVGSNKIGSTIYVGGALTNSTTYTYDEANRMKTVSESGVLQCTYSYDANGNRSSMVYANGVTTEYSYNLANMLKTLTNRSGGAVLSSYSYEYQLDGNQTGKTDQSGKVTNYVYDGLGRLTSEAEKTGGTVTFSLAYQYDASSNRTSMTANDGAVTSYVYDKNNRLTSTTDASGTTAYSYDNNGNTLKKTSGGTTETYGYDLLNRMTSSNVGGVATTYKYRADGLRFSKTTNGVETAHIWDGTNIVGDIVNDAVSTTYVRGINLIASKNGGVYKYYVYNGHGDTVQIYSFTGAVLQTYDYDAFGNQREIENPCRYNGTYFDQSSGIYTSDFYTFYYGSKSIVTRPDTGKSVEGLVFTPNWDGSRAWSLTCDTDPNAVYVLEFDYWSDTGGNQVRAYAETDVWNNIFVFASDIMTCSTTVQHARFEFTPGSSHVSVSLGVFSGVGYITNIHFYNKETVETEDYAVPGTIESTSDINTFYYGSKSTVTRPDTGERVEGIVFTPNWDGSRAWVAGCDVDPSAVYVLEFDYWSDTGGNFTGVVVETGVLSNDYILLSRYIPCSTTVQHARFELTPETGYICASMGIMSGVGYVTNVRLYEKAGSSHASAKNTSDINSLYWADKVYAVRPDTGDTVKAVRFTIK